MKNFVEHIFDGETTTSYNYNKTFVGSGNFIKQYTGLNSEDKYISTITIPVGRPMEASTAIAVGYPHVIQWSTTKNWVFAVDTASTTTKRVIMYEHDLITNVLNWIGGISMATPGGSITARGFRMTYDLYTTGTTSVSGTAVTGTTTEWTDSGFAAGARIGFGSTTPSDITNWYEISSINSNTSITLLTNAGTLTDVPYVIEELRVVLSTTNTTPANGGLFLIKGLNPADFTSTPKVISYATTVDNIKAIYWLADAAVVTMTASWGLSLDDKVNNNEQYVYIPNGAVAANSYFISKYNIRASLTSISAGKTTSAYLYKTGAINAALVGTVIQSNNGRLATLQHSPVNGEKCLYFVTTTRVYRCRLANITDGSTDYIIDNMVEVPPGGTSTYNLSSFSSIEESGVIDRLVITGAAAGRSYVTKYNTTSTSFDTIFLANDLQSDQSSADSSAPIHPSTNGIVMSCYSEGGRLYLIRNGTTAVLNQLYVLPLNAHRLWADDVGEYVITPKLSTLGATTYYRCYVNSDRQNGDNTFGVPSEDFDFLYRISGIDDNSGSWVTVPEDGNMSGVVADYIQFKIRFKTLGTFCVPAKIYSILVVYEDSTTDSHYTPSINKSNATNRIFAYRQTLTWGGTIPNLKIKIYNASTGSLVLDDDITSHSFGVWEYSTDGTTWNSWDSSQDSVGNYIRYTATTLPAGIVARALLTQ